MTLNGWKTCRRSTSQRSARSSSRTARIAVTCTICEPSQRSSLVVHTGTMTHRPPRFDALRRSDAPARPAFRSTGRWVEATDGACDEVRDPYTGDVVGLVRARRPRADARRRSSGRRRAARPGPRCRRRRRARSCARWYDLIVANADDLATILTAEQGKPLAEAQGRDPLRRRRSSSGTPRRPSAPTARSSRPPLAGRRLLTLRQPGRRLRGDHAVELPDGR